MGTSFASVLLNTAHIQSEQKLWRGVLCNALEDASLDQNDRKSSIYKSQAHNWILAKSKDFEEVCYWAGFTPEHVNERYTKAVQNLELRGLSIISNTINTGILKILNLSVTTKYEWKI
jgi:hypothetical protein